MDLQNGPGGFTILLMTVINEGRFIFSSFGFTLNTKTRSENK